jgi:hypothetical protein
MFIVGNSMDLSGDMRYERLPNWLGGLPVVLLTT